MAGAEQPAQGASELKTERGGRGRAAAGAGTQVPVRHTSCGRSSFQYLPPKRRPHEVLWGLHPQPWDLGRVPVVVEMALPPCWASLVAQTVRNPPAMQES